MVAQSCMRVDPPALGAGLENAFGDFDYCFTDKELQDILGVIEQKAQGGAEGDLLGDIFSDTAAAQHVFHTNTAQGALPLQFQPAEPPAVPVKNEDGTTALVGASGVSSFASTPAFQSPDNQRQGLMAQVPAPSTLGLAEQQAAVHHIMAAQAPAGILSSAQPGRAGPPPPALVVAAGMPAPLVSPTAASALSPPALPGVASSAQLAAFAGAPLAIAASLSAAGSMSMQRGGGSKAGGVRTWPLTQWCM